MKKIIFSFFLFLFLTVPQYSFAQQIDCSVVDAGNNQDCCKGRNYALNQNACEEYQNVLNAGGAGTIGSGGGQNTNPQNGGVTPPGTIAPTPQTSSTALLSCSKISFISLLDILIWLKCIIGAAIIPFIFALAFLFFLWGMAMYIRGSDDVKKREESKKFIYGGIIGLTVMVSVWGIVKIVNSTFGLGNTVPKLQTDYLKVPTKK